MVRDEEKETDRQTGRQIDNRQTDREQEKKKNYITEKYVNWQLNIFSQVVGMVLLLDGSLEYDAYYKSKIHNLTYLRHLFTSTASNFVYIYLNICFTIHFCAMCSELPSNIGTMKKGEQ